MPHQVRVHGRDVVVERPFGSRPRLTVDGVELPRDRLGRYVLTDDAGDARVVDTSLDWKQLAPVLRVGEEKVLTAPPLPRGAWWLLAPVVALVLIGGALGAALGMGAAVLAASHLRRSPAGWPRWVGAGAIVLLAFVVHWCVVAVLRDVI
ncbi:hypothetical protein [Cellulomonas endometrii]|jgi:hypothetical protein|uniref:hypothetical protein n=1 Tax=Cellulomonas endometrii TaxID=3036301 RepID=UPI0024ACF0CE|nr:hypothetical protein [Cellulomonas endometrii]